MKTKSTLKHLFGSSLFVLAGFSFSFGQSNAISAGSGPVTTEDVVYELAISESIYKSGTGSSGLKVTSSINSIDIKDISDVDVTGLLYQVTIPSGTPVGSGLSIQIEGYPFWHVTVADILGHVESTEDVVMRPLGVSEESEGTGNSTSIVVPTVPNGGATSNSVKNNTKLDLFPNPATDHISIVTEGEVLWGVCEVIDITGKKVLEIPTGASSPNSGVTSQTVVVSGMKPGTYFLRFRTNKDVYTKRFQVAR